MIHFKKGLRSLFPTCALILLLVSCEQDNENRAASESDGDIELYAEEVAAAAHHLIEVTPADLRDSLVFPFYSDSRTTGPATHQTPSFCAVVAWCSKGWGLQLGELNQEQLVAAHKILNLALSPGGYQILRSVLNHQRIIGETEDIGASATVKNAIAAGLEQPANTIFDFQGDVPDSLFYPALAGGGRPSASGTPVNWVWEPLSGTKGRWAQFLRYTLAIFGEPGGEAWGFRFEGHHITLNITFLRDAETGRLRVHTTPLFFGTFPMIIPATPFPKEDPTHQWNWEKGQLMMYNVAHHLHHFWLSVPDQLRTKAKIPPKFFSQAPPLILDTPVPSMISALETKVDPATIRTYPHVEIHTDDLSDEALWHLRQAFYFYSGAMHPDIRQLYEDRINTALTSGQPLTLSWAGSSLEKVGNRHYSYLIVGSLLLEFLQSNQFLVQHNPDVTGNHLHSMLRDLSFDWVDPMHTHHLDDHLSKH